MCPLLIADHQDHERVFAKFCAKRSSATKLLALLVWRFPMSDGRAVTGLDRTCFRPGWSSRADDHSSRTRRIHSPQHFGSAGYVTPARSVSGSPGVVAI